MSEGRRAAYRTRLDAVFARRAPKAVILRRGPRTRHHLIAWDLETDVFTYGQWMKGRVALCDLSPDGTRLLYIAEQYHASASWRREAPAASGYEPLRQAAPRRASKRHAQRRKVPRYQRPSGLREIGRRWTALSKPPYFSALAFWPSLGAATGGGLFLSDDELALRESGEGLTPRGPTPPPPAFKIAPFSEAADRIRPEEWATEAWPEGAAPLTARRAVERALQGAGAGWVEFVSPRPEGDLLFGCDGKAFRLPDWRAVAPERYLAEARMLADFNGLRFALVPPGADALSW